MAELFKTPVQVLENFIVEDFNESPLYSIAIFHTAPQRSGPCQLRLGDAGSNSEFVAVTSVSCSGLSLQSTLKRYNWCSR